MNLFSIVMHVQILHAVDDVGTERVEQYETVFKIHAEALGRFDVVFVHLGQGLEIIKRMVYRMVPGIRYITTFKTQDRVGNIQMRHLEQMNVSRYLFMGSNGPDIPYLNEENRGTSIFADMFHYNRAIEFIIQCLTIARSLHDQNNRRRFIAYTLGHISHIITDAIVHPYINMIAGAYLHQVIPDLHRSVEMEQDSWIAIDYFRRREINTGPSWTNFLPDPGDMSDRVFESIRNAIGITYGRFPPERYLIDAYDFFYNTAIDIGYDTGSHRANDFGSGFGQFLSNWHDRPVMELVNHPYLNMRLVDLFDESAGKSLDACADAVQFYEGNITADQFRSKLRSYDLDVGYYLDVIINSNTLEITLRHTWEQAKVPVNNLQPEPIEIRLTDEDKNPIPSVKYRITTPDGNIEAEGMLDSSGYAKIEGVSASVYHIEFPDLNNQIIIEE